MTDTPNLDLIVRHYVAAALWSSTGDDCEPLDAWATIDDVAPATLEAMRDDCAAFIVSAAALIEQCKLSPEQADHLDVAADMAWSLPGAPLTAWPYD